MLEPRPTSSPGKDPFFAFRRQVRQPISRTIHSKCFSKNMHAPQRLPSDGPGQTRTAYGTHAASGCAGTRGGCRRQSGSLFFWQGSACHEVSQGLYLASIDAIACDRCSFRTVPSLSAEQLCVGIRGTSLPGYARHVYLPGTPLLTSKCAFKLVFLTPFTDSTSLRCVTSDLFHAVLVGCSTRPVRGTTMACDRG